MSCMEQLNYKLVKGKTLTSKNVTVVFLHGFLESIKMWEHLDLESFPFDSLLIDLPGHGYSTHESEATPSIDYYTSKVEELLNALRLNNFIGIVGHSMGGYVALDLKKKSLKTIKVVLLNSNFWADSEHKKKDRLRVADIVMKNKSLFIKEAIPNLFLDKILFSDEIYKLIEESSKMTSFSIAFAALSMRERKDNATLLNDFSDDFLVIQGEKDTIVPFEEMLFQSKNIPFKMEVIENSGHMSFLENSNRINFLLHEFFNKTLKHHFID